MSSYIRSQLTILFSLQTIQYNIQSVLQTSIQEEGGLQSEWRDVKLFFRFQEDPCKHMFTWLLLLDSLFLSPALSAVFFVR